MENLGRAIQTFINSQLVPLGFVVGVAALVVVGFALVGGTHSLKEWAKNHIYTIIAGLVLIYLAANIAQSFITSLGGTITQF